MALDDLLNVSPAPAKPASEPLESGSIFDIALHSLSTGARKPKLTGEEVNSLAEALVEGYLSYFAQADATIKWLDAEREHAIWLCPPTCECEGNGRFKHLDRELGKIVTLPCTKSRTLLVGRIDAVGQTQDGEPFFLELKTAKPPWKGRRDEWRAKWLMSPQSLTYGVIAASAYPGMSRFTVRMAYKSLPPTYDFEWFRFTGAEVAWWRAELIRIADEIRGRRKEGGEGVPWAPNFEHCYKYGADYVCPRFHPACSQLKWNEAIPNSVPRVPHLEVEQNWLKENTGSFGQPMRKGVVVLDATRVEKWMGCRERYRGEYELGVREPEGEALSVGTDFHLLLSHYYRKMGAK